MFKHASHIHNILHPNNFGFIVLYNIEYIMPYKYFVFNKVKLLNKNR